MNKIQEAFDLLNQLLAWQPKQVNTLVNRGFVYESKGELAKAKTDYESAIALDPDAFQALLNLCGLELRLGNKTKANSYYTRLQKLNPQHPGVKKISNTFNN